MLPQIINLLVSMILFTQVWTVQWSDTIPSWNVQFQLGIHLTWFCFNRLPLFSIQSPEALSSPQDCQVRRVLGFICGLTFSNELISHIDTNFSCLLFNHLNHHPHPETVEWEGSQWSSLGSAKEPGKSWEWAGNPRWILQGSKQGWIHHVTTTCNVYIQNI